FQSRGTVNGIVILARLSLEHSDRTPCLMIQTHPCKTVHTEYGAVDDRIDRIADTGEVSAPLGTCRHVIPCHYRIGCAYGQHSRPCPCPVHQYAVQPDIESPGPHLGNIAKKFSPPYRRVKRCCAHKILRQLVEILQGSTDTPSPGTKFQR